MPDDLPSRCTPSQFGRVGQTVGGRRAGGSSLAACGRNWQSGVRARMIGRDGLHDTNVSMSGKPYKRTRGWRRVTLRCRPQAPGRRKLRCLAARRRGGGARLLPRGPGGRHDGHVAAVSFSSRRGGGEHRGAGDDLLPDCATGARGSSWFRWIRGLADRFADMQALRQARRYRHGLAVHLLRFFYGGSEPGTGLRMETHSESPAGAGISGSSALMIASAAALARLAGASFRGSRFERLRRTWRRN